MTPEERADEILDIVLAPKPGAWFSKRTIREAIANQIREVMIEQYEGEKSPVAKIEHEAYAKGIAEERERCAKIVEEGQGSCCMCDRDQADIANAIREHK